MCVLSCTNLSAFRSDRSAVLNKITHNFSPGLTGLVGANGCGKTTLLTLLSGKVTPEAGQVSSVGQIALQRQNLPEGQRVVDVFGVGPAYDVLQQILSGSLIPEDMARIDWTIEVRVETACIKVGLNLLPDDMIGKLSGGQRMRLSLAACFFKDPNILLLDEPTNNLDAESAGYVRQALQNFQGIAVIASHDRSLLALMDGILALETGEGRYFGGNYDMFKTDEKARADRANVAYNQAMQDLRRLKGDHEKAQTRLARSRRRGKQKRSDGSQPKIAIDAKAEKASAGLSRHAKNVEYQSDKVQENLRLAKGNMSRFTEINMGLDVPTLPQGKHILSCLGLGLKFGEKTILNNVCFDIYGADRVALCGLNGSGKTQLLKCIVGHQIPSSGQIGLRVPFAYLEQDTAGLSPEKSLFETFTERHPTVERNTCFAALARFGFRAIQAHRQIGSLSGGEKMRAALAVALGGNQPPQLLILDEPTNHLDLRAQEEIESVLAQYKGALLVVSHDDVFLQSIGISRRILIQSFQSQGSENSMELPAGSRT
ncbi:MAG: ABC-F family ATP-binding cassette domain-containing protein [Pseudoruegeria sp.]